MNEQPTYITQTEAATILGIDRTTLWRWVKNKRIRPATHITGNVPLFDRSEIEREAERRSKKEAVA